MLGVKFNKDAPFYYSKAVINVPMKITGVDIINAIRYISDSWGFKKVTRKSVSEYLKVNYRIINTTPDWSNKGEFFINKTDALALRLFPDWFGENSLDFILKK